MSILDIILGLLLLYGLYKGLKNGLLLEIASILALIAGLYGAIHFSYFAGDYLAQHTSWDARNIHLAAFILTFIVIVIVVHFVGRVLTKILDIAMLGMLNKIAGGIFGTFKVAVLLGALLVFFDQTNTSLGMVKNDTIQKSVLYGPIKDIGALVFSKVLKRKEATDLQDPTDQ